MKILADENVELRIIERLRASGHDVVAIAETDASAGDDHVLERALREQRILVTNDKDFAWLLFFQRRAAQGVVLIRMPHTNGDSRARRVVEVFARSEEQLFGLLTVVEVDGVRTRRFGET